VVPLLRGGFAVSGWLRWESSGHPVSVVENHASSFNAQLLLLRGDLARRVWRKVCHERCATMDCDDTYQYIVDTQKQRSEHLAPARLSTLVQLSGRQWKQSLGLVGILLRK
jgi:hypothetical protein